MKVLFLLLMHYVTGEGMVDIKPKSVNVNFETIFEFDQNRNSEELNLIEKVQNFLSNVKVSLRNARRSFDQSSDNESIKNYLEKAIKAILDFRDNEMEDLIVIFKKEIDKYSVLEKKLSYRRILAIDSDDEYSKKISVPIVRKHLERALDSMDTLRGDEKFMLDSVNLILKDKPKDKLDGFIQNLESFSKKTKRDNVDLRQVLRQGLKDLYINYYFNLDTNAKDIVSNIIKKIFVIFRSKFTNEDAGKELRKGSSDSTSDSDVQSEEIKLPERQHISTKEEVEEESKVTELVSSEFEATTIKETKPTTVKRKRKHKLKSTTAKSYMHSLWLEEINVHFETTKKVKRTKHKLRSPKHFHPQNKRFRIKSSRDDDDDSKDYKRENRHKKKKNTQVKKEKDLRKAKIDFIPKDDHSIEFNADEGLVLPAQPYRRMIVDTSTKDKVISTTKSALNITHTTENVVKIYERNNNYYNGYNNGISDKNNTTKEMLTSINNYKQTATLPTTIKNIEQITETSENIVKEITTITEKSKETLTTKVFKPTTSPITTLKTTTTLPTEATTQENVIRNITVSDKIKNNATLATNIDVGKKNVVNDVDNKINK